MKKFIIVLLTIFLGLLYSCSTVREFQPLSFYERANLIFIGSVKIESEHFSNKKGVTGKVKRKAYILLKREAAEKYPDYYYIRNIVVSRDGRSRRFNATCDVYKINTKREIEVSLAKAAEKIMSSIQPNSRIAIVYISSSDVDITEYISLELEFFMVNGGFTIIDRIQLDRIRREQDFQLSGEVDDETAVSIGKVVGANVIITGSITGADSTRRLRLRALNSQTAQVVAVSSEPL